MKEGSGRDSPVDQTGIGQLNCIHNYYSQIDVPKLQKTNNTVSMPV